MTVKLENYRLNPSTTTRNNCDIYRTIWSRNIAFISYTLRTNAEINAIMLRQNREQDSRNNDL